MLWTVSWWSFFFFCWNIRWQVNPFYCLLLHALKYRICLAKMAHFRQDSIFQYQSFDLEPNHSQTLSFELNFFQNKLLQKCPKLKISDSTLAALGIPLHTHDRQYASGIDLLEMQRYIQQADKTFIHIIHIIFLVYL